MRRKLSAAAVAGAAVCAMALAPAGASAAHCVSPAGSSPGFSWFGTVHVKATGHDSEGIDPGHAGTPGASNCITTAGNPGNGQND